MLQGCGSEMGWIFLFLKMFSNIGRYFSLPPLCRRKGAIGICWAEARDVAEQLSVHRQPHSKDCPSAGPAPRCPVLAGIESCQVGSHLRAKDVGKCYNFTCKDLFVCVQRELGKS